MTTLSFDLVSHAELARVSAAFGGGAHVVLGTERDGTNTLVELAAGMARPGTGRVTLNGQQPFAHAMTRRQIGALSAAEQLPPGGDVSSALSAALRARGDARSALSVLDGAGVAHFAARRVLDLSLRELRAVALVLALSHPAPVLLALFEPLALLEILSVDFLLQTLARLAGAGTVVLSTASRVEDAARLGGATSAIERGIWLDSPAARPPLSQVTVRVHTADPRRLAARLSQAPDVSAVEWAGGHELLVRGSDLERVASLVVSSARSEAITIEALRYDPPGLDALAAARAGLAQACYDRERVQRESRARAADAEPPSAARGGLR
jgi:ABC-2 type transport system ATP-binding protein